MSHGKRRADKNCLNCGRTVEQRFCPHCGQENIQTRQPFHYLFTHFVEDFTHYDGQFWGTMKNLIFRPGKLTNTYLEGKRQEFVPPVKLYIFVSFIVFFFLSILPSEKKSETEKDEYFTSAVSNEESRNGAIKEMLQLKEQGLLTEQQSKIAIEKIEKEKEGDRKNESLIGSSSLEDYDKSVEKENRFFGKLFRPFVVKFFELSKKGVTRGELKDKISDKFSKAVPKALFIYLPLFALFLWVFHNKKRWWYFDHGIFTLHYFSFLLVITLLTTAMQTVVESVSYPFLDTLFSIIAFLIICYTVFYFFVAHHQVYKSRKRITILRGVLIFIANSVFMLLLIFILLAYSFLNIN
ncbi:DUF3667 domain-containing protein [Sphingobacterium deserti]|uniref:DUF3667 domain-containing protein n=1 Tax=Sphingobacterium deserti TaxID=1229276 RepID=A0A0B8T3M7_9SPHI|nr:DUF3667 domain-containing protein [Sphingobacterium deserti]KGE13713.1 hypothetical protein DI53_2506 [Sphingobacterium deserti]